MKTVVIDRAKWAIPRQTENPLLFNSLEDTRCCLGFYVKSCGVSDYDAEGVSLPSELSVSMAGQKKLQELADTWQSPWLNLARDWESVLSSINDAEGIDDATREAWVREGFKRILKRRVRFVGKYRVPEEKQ